MESLPWTAIDLARLQQRESLPCTPLSPPHLQQRVLTQRQVQHIKCLVRFCCKLRALLPEPLELGRAAVVDLEVGQLNSIGRDAVLRGREGRAR